MAEDADRSGEVREVPLRQAGPLDGGALRVERSVVEPAPELDRDVAVAQLFVEEARQSLLYRRRRYLLVPEAFLGSRRPPDFFRR